ncbi:MULTISPECIES: hypothetical protein [Pseudomonas]|nr:MULTISPECIES: hypothetical protein [Pseudomonas]MBI6921849.1 hypothetical protein [Pseudomonas monteilii]MCE0940307.1 hypothetical protein [Pseudomonas kurunegalensis]MDD2137396.1 hypothetical protein [Pseudomonas kurunegalensis]MDR2318472.1 hypothetical protein [Pseudomonas sp.]
MPHWLRRMICGLYRHKPVEVERLFIGEIVISRQVCRRCGCPLRDLAEYQ